MSDPQKKSVYFRSSIYISIHQLDKVFTQRSDSGKHEIQNHSSSLLQDLCIHIVMHLKYGSYATGNSRRLTRHVRIIRIHVTLLNNILSMSFLGFTSYLRNILILREANLGASLILELFQGAGWRLK